jgi:hypothetical protein
MTGTETGLSLSQSPAFTGTGIVAGGATVIVDNDIQGGCGSTCRSGGVGVSGATAGGLFEDNHVLGSCGPAFSCPETRGGDRGLVLSSGPEHEWLVRRNTITATPGMPCTATSCSPGYPPAIAVLFSGTTGVFEDNVLIPGATCRDNTSFFETGTGTHPRIFANNHLAANPAPYAGALYLDDVAGRLLTADAVDALTDTQASGTGAELCAAP